MKGEVERRKRKTWLRQERLVKGRLVFAGLQISSLGTESDAPKVRVGLGNSEYSVHPSFKKIAAQVQSVFNYPRV